MWITDNVAVRGGGVGSIRSNHPSAEPGSLQIVNSTISGNHARTGAGGRDPYGGYGGGVFSNGHLKTLILNSTISGNTARVAGGLDLSGEMTISHSTITDNSGVGLENSSSFHLTTIHNSVIAGNGDQFRTDVRFRAEVNVAFSLIGNASVHDLAEAPVGTPDSNGNLIGGPVHGVIDSLLGALSNNGGPTLTHALLPGSPAINRGDLNAFAGIGGVPLNDQRGDGFDRIFSRIDIGAYEVQELGDMNLLVDTLVDESDGDFSRGDLSLREAIELANANPVPDTIGFDQILTAVAGPLPATILLTEGELQITDDLTINGLGAELLTIDASGNDPTPDEDNQDGSRIFTIEDGSSREIADVLIHGLALTGGDFYSGGAIASNESLSLSYVNIFGNSGTGIFTLTSGDININNSAISDNSEVGLISYGTTTISNSVFSGNLRGGIVAERFLSLSSSYVLNNSGSGIYALGTIVIDNTLISGNTRNSGIYIEGNATIADSVITNNSGASHGGGIWFSGELTIMNSEISNNTASHNGGGIYSQFDTLTIVNSKILDNSTRDVSGGGIFSRGMTNIISSTISGNSAGFSGGGIQSSGTTNISDTTVSNNSVGGFGGGLRAFGTTTIIGSTFTNNTAGRDGGAIWAEPAFSETTTISSSTISGNAAGNSGGGIWGRGLTNVVHSTITNNNLDAENNGEGAGGGVFIYRGRLDLNHSIVAGNHDNFGTAHDVAGVVNSNFSLIGFGAEFFGPLQDNGGPTMTHALLPGSPAINAGDLNAIAGVDGVPEFDQRGDGFDRIVSRIDIGAFEFQALGDMNLLVDTLVDESDGDFSRGDLSLREAIELANVNPVLDTIRFDPILVGGTILMTSGEMRIIGDTDIVGLGAEHLTIDASNSQSSIFNVNDRLGGTLSHVSIAGLTLTGSRGSAILSQENLTIESSILHNNQGGEGGAINVSAFGRQLNEAQLRIRDSTIRDNVASRYGGGVFFRGRYGSLIMENATISGNSVGSRGSGGGVHASGFANQMRLESVTFTDNSAHVGGGVAISDDNAGLATIIDSVITGNTATFRGGGLNLSGKPVDIVRTSITHNTALDQARGGGMHVSERISVTDSTIAYNTASSGGGIWGLGGTLTVTGSEVSNNEAVEGIGGGIGGSFGEVTVLHSEILDNISTNGSGGGIGVMRSSLLVERSTISGNVASESGGGVYSYDSLSQPGTLTVIASSTISSNSAATNGGGLFGNFRPILNSTISSNSAGGSGGGIYTFGTSIISHSTVTLNRSDIDSSGRSAGGGVFVASGTTTFYNTIIAQNRDDSGIARDVSGFLGAVLQPNHSVIGWNVGSGLLESPLGSPDANGNLIGGVINRGINALLGPLADNGGPNQTHALLVGSPAIDAGDPALQQGRRSLPEFDQRGPPFARMVGGRIDIGAFEVQSSGGTFDADFDFDGDVDGSDFLNWQRNLGSIARPTKADGDATGNGVIDGNDLAVWQATYGNEQPNGAAASAETVDLALAGILLEFNAETPESEPAIVKRTSNVVFNRHAHASLDPLSELRRPRPLAYEPFDSHNAKPPEFFSDSLTLENAFDEIFAELGS